MKKLYFLFFLFQVLFFSAQTDVLNVPGPIDYNGVSFNLGKSEQPSKIRYVQEYFPDGERPEEFSQMISVTVFDKDINIDDAAESKAKELERRKETDRNCSYNILESPDGKEILIDFVTSAGEGKKTEYAEFTVYRFKNISPVEGKTAFVIFSYTTRAEGEAANSLLKSIKRARNLYINQMISLQIPEIKIPGY